MCKAVYDDPTLIDKYADANPDDLAPSDLATVRSWKLFIKGKFFAYRYTEANTVFIYLDGGDPPKAYGVMSLNRPLYMILGPDRPKMVETTLLPFRSRIVYDGIIATHAIAFGRNITAQANGWYEQALRSGGPILDLFGTGSTGTQEKVTPVNHRVKEKPVSDRGTNQEAIYLEAINESLRQTTDTQNRDPLDDFEGLSPEEMHWLLCSPFDSEKSPMQVAEDVPEEFLKGTVFPEDLRRYLLRVREEAPIKLTATGALSRAFCRELVAEGFDQDHVEWFKEYPLMREEDSYNITLLDSFTRGMSLTKQKGNRLSLTSDGDATLKASPSKRFIAFFKMYAQRYNWGYGDRYPAAYIIQQGFGFSLYLLSLYGCEPRDDHFYSERFLRAFPMVLDDFEGAANESKVELFHYIYSIRTIKRFIGRFGLAEEFGEKRRQTAIIIHKTPLLDALIKWKGMPER